VIPLNQLIPECLLALGGAYLLGNLAAYIRLRPAWRDAKEGHGGRAAKRNAKQPQDARAVNHGEVKGGGGRAVNATTGTRGKAGRTGPRTGRGTRPAGTVPGQTGSGERRQGQVRPASANAADGSGSGSANAADGSGSGSANAAGAKAAGAKAAAGPRAGSSGRVNARVPEPTRSGSKLPSRTRVLTNVLIGLLISAAALATLIRG
jgi:hypothetical protein